MSLRPVVVLGVLALVGFGALIGMKQTSPAGVAAAPDFIGGTGWLNSAPLSIGSLRGKVVLVDFWEYTCVNCIRTFPYVTEWHRRYAKDGLVIVGVHTPEFEFGRERKNVEEAVRRFGISYPVVLDSDRKIWSAYENRFWPRKYLIDKNGIIRYDHIGEGEYDATEAQIQKLLLEVNPAARFTKPMAPVRDIDKPGAVCYPTTPELYAGYLRGALGNREGYKKDQVVTYKDDGLYIDGQIMVHGRWRNLPESLRHAEKLEAPSAFVAIRYHAADVNAVLKPETGAPYRVWLEHDGKPLSPEDRGGDVRFERGKAYVLVDAPRMYHLIKNRKNRTLIPHVLKMHTDSDSFGIYAFTFGPACDLPGDKQ